MSNEAQQIIEEVNEGEVTEGELITVVAMYPAHHHDTYLDAIREALQIIREQNNANK